MNHNQHLSSSIISLTFLFKRSKSEGLTASSFKGPVPFVLGFPNGKESACQGKRCQFVAWVGKIPWRRAWQPTPAFLPGGSHGQRSLADYSPLCNKELDTTEHTHTHTSLHVTTPITQRDTVLRGSTWFNIWSLTYFLTMQLQRTFRIEGWHHLEIICCLFRKSMRNAAAASAYHSSNAD